MRRALPFASSCYSGSWDSLVPRSGRVLATSPVFVRARFAFRNCVTTTSFCYYENANACKRPNTTPKPVPRVCCRDTRILLIWHRFGFIVGISPVAGFYRSRLTLAYFHRESPLLGGRGNNSRSVSIGRGSYRR
jgi:hypothetical protein